MEEQSATPAQEHHGDSVIKDSPPRVWALAVVFLLAFATFLSASAFAGMLAVFIVEGTLANSGHLADSDLLSKVLHNPWSFTASVLPSQLTLIFWAGLAAALSPLGWRSRLQITPGGWSASKTVLIASATPLISLLSTLVLSFLIEPSSQLLILTEAFETLREHGYLWLLIFVVGIAPAIGEEVFFRGYLQSRLCQRWPPAVGILLTSLLFAGFHLDPVHILAVIPLGIWLGTLAFLSRSIWPAILGHGINNTLSVWTASTGENIFALPAPWLTFAILSFGLAGFACLFHEFRRYRSAMQKR